MGAKDAVRDLAESTHGTNFKDGENARPVKGTVCNLLRIGSGYTMTQSNVGRRQRVVACNFPCC
jgi:hypothetical protein